MKLPNTNKLLLWNFTPFFICCFFLYIPYYFFSKTDLFSIELRYDKSEHTLYGLLPVALILLAALLGGNKKSSYERSDVRVFSVSAKAKLFVIVLLLISLGVQTAQTLMGVFAFAGGGYLAAREVFAIEGIGIILRLDIFLLPLLAATGYPRRKFFFFFILSALNHVFRALLMSERIAINEIIYIAWLAFPFVGIYGLPLRKLTLILSVVLLSFSVLLGARLDEQSQVGGQFTSSDASLSGSLSAYYADTMNKYYRILDGEFEYPAVQFIQPISALFRNKETDGVGFSDFLSNTGQSSGALSAGLNNPGGLAQDVSDFGVIGLVVIFIKFWLISFFWFRRYENLLYLSISPILLVTVVEYPRFNYLYAPFAFYLFLIAIVVGVIMHANCFAKK